MKNFFIFLFFLYTVLFVYPDSSDDVLKVDIDTAVSKAVAHNFTLKNNKLDLNVNKLLLATSWNKFLPNANFQTSIGRNYSYSSGVDTTSDAIGISFSTGLSLNAKVIFDIRQLALNWKSGSLTVLQAENNLKNIIKKDYFNIIILKKQIELLDRQIENAKVRYDTALLQFKLGALSEIDKLNNEYTYKSLSYNRNQAYNSYQTGLFQLKQLLGIDNKKNVELTSDLPEIIPLDYNKILNNSIENNLDIQLLALSLSGSENARNSDISSMTPSVGFSYSFSSSFTSDKYEDKRLIYNYDWDKSSQIKFYLSFPLDVLFPFSSIQTNIIKDQVNIEKIKNNLQDLKETSMNNALTLVMKLKQDEENINSLLVNAQIAENSYVMTQKLFASGGKTLLDVKDAENTWFDAKNKIFGAKYDFLSNYLDLKYLLNIDDKGGAK